MSSNPQILTYPLWLIADDLFYYKNSDKLCELLNFDYNTKKVVLPSLDDSSEFLKLIREHEGFIVLSTTNPPKQLKDLFIVRELPPKFEILTTQQHEAKIPERLVWEQRLGLSVIDSPFTLDDIGGAQKLKEYANNLISAERLGFKAKGIFLVGIPGTGKTFFPKCFAGQLKRPLIQLNISMIMESPEPINRLNAIFSFLDKRQKEFPDSKCIILIDEIEKMIGNVAPEEKRMLGRLLTVLNDMHTPASEYSFNATFFATANDLGVILDNNPELLRRGRWNELFFVNMPTHESAKEIFSIYIKKKGLDFLFESGKITLEDLITEICSEYDKTNPSPRHFPYTAAEIENFCERLHFLRLAKREENFDIEKSVKQCIKEILPIGKSASRSIERMLGQSELFTEI